MSYGVNLLKKRINEHVSLNDKEIKFIKDLKDRNTGAKYLFLRNTFVEHYEDLEIGQAISDYYKELIFYDKNKKEVFFCYVDFNFFKGLDYGIFHRISDLIDGYKEENIKNEE